MRMKFVPRGGIGLGVLLCAAAAAAGSAVAQPSTAQIPVDRVPRVDPASVPVPEIAFEPTGEDVRNYDKYYFFQRDDTDFATAYADLRECDGYARGFGYRAYGSPMAAHETLTYIPPGMNPLAAGIGGAIGGVIGAQLSDAIFGSAERRRLRRVNMRNCMGFKGYGVFGLRKSLWEEFNFDEGNRQLPEAERQRFLQMQARLASGPRPAVGEITQ